MKIDAIRTVIAVAISALLAYACYEICEFERIQWVITIGAFVTIAIPAVFAMGVTAKESRNALMLVTLSWIMLISEAIINFTFVFFDFSIPTYVIVNGLTLSIYILIYSSIYRTKK